MSVKRAITILVLLAMGVLMAAGVAVLFDLRFEGGDNYPPYSTLRADPLGARALFDSLGALPELEVARNLRPLSELKEGAGATLFYLGAQADGLRWFSGDDSRHLEEFLMDGGRVVLALAPEARDPFQNASSTSFTLPAAKATSSTLAAKAAPSTSSTLSTASLPAIYPLPRSIRKAESEEAERQKREEEEKEKRKQSGEDEDSEDSEIKVPLLVSLTSKLDLELGFRPLPQDPKRKAYLPAEAALAKGEGLPKTLPWRSGVTVRRMSKDWRTVYGRGKEAVLIERAYGKGSLVVATDSFFASNEALRDERQAALLAWLVGPARRVVFDETHLRIREDVGVMDLALRYRLHGVFAVLLALAGLFIWKSASPLVPPPAEETGMVRGRRGQDGRDATAGLVDLLGRNVGREKILGVCLTEWAKGRAGAPGTKEMEKQMREIAEVEEAQPAGKKNIVQAYRAMAEVVKRRGRK